MKESHILLVEDNEGDIILTIEAFEESNINSKISVVKNGRDALDFLFKKGEFDTVEKPDLILLDLNIPIFNGLDVLKRIKEDNLLKKIPVIILSTSSNQKEIDKTYEYHANSYIVKPLDMDEYLQVIFKMGEYWLQLSKLSE